MLSVQQTAQYYTDGYIVVPGLLDKDETDILAEISRLDARLAGMMNVRLDATGGKTTLALDNNLGDDIYSAIVRSNRIFEATTQILSDEPYHYHHKVSAKQPYEGGAWEWHQDYGYWYNNGCLFPNMVSCYIAIDPATRENGCLQVLRGSHLIGRLDHGKTGGQTGADMERVNAALEQLELVYVELAAGDAVYFHCNTLHRSDQNRSPNPRWGLICCYNARHNSPYKDGPHPRYTPLEPLPDAEVVEVGRRQLASLEAQAAESAMTV